MNNMNKEEQMEKVLKKQIAKILGRLIVVDGLLTDEGKRAVVKVMDELAPLEIIKLTE